ncbi:hypothetical protein GZL_01955 [Streptomyces sp. 769]|nr:hypothetical protein GZL_01955 [Streptomyces sp. 769]
MWGPAHLTGLKRTVVTDIVLRRPERQRVVHDSDAAPHGVRRVSREGAPRGAVAVRWPTPVRAFNATAP